MLTLFAFITAILILVSLHELGHFAVARLFGVKVVRFSVGFGTPFLKKKIGATEWCLAPIPLGGYVKMVDTREGNVDDADLPYAFDKQHPAKRMAIVAAGPLTNLLLAVLLFGASFSFGITETRPWVGTVVPASIADHAGFQSGDRIELVNQKVVKDWADAQTKIVLNLDAGKVNVAVRTEDGHPAVRVIDVAGTEQAATVAKRGGFIGLMPSRIINRIDEVSPNGAAAKAGLKKGDTLLAVNGEGLADWQAWVERVRRSAGQKLQITYERNGSQHEVTLRPDSVVHEGLIIGQVGVAPMQDEIWAAQVQQHSVPSVAAAFALGAQKTWDYSALTVQFLGRLLTGQASLNHISGPVTIADVAGKTAAIGLQSYVEFLALVSVSLGILNFLPIPVLDGGHLLYYAVEWLRGKPVSERVQQLGLRLGIFLMLTLMFVAFFNDITRLFG